MLKRFTCYVQSKPVNRRSVVPPFTNLVSILWYRSKKKMVFVWLAYSDVSSWNPVDIKRTKINEKSRRQSWPIYENKNKMKRGAIYTSRIVHSSSSDCCCCSSTNERKITVRRRLQQKLFLVSPVFLLGGGLFFARLGRRTF